MSVGNVQGSGQVAQPQQPSSQPVSPGRDGHRHVAMSPNAGRALPTPPLPPRGGGAVAQTAPPLPARSTATHPTSKSTGWKAVSPSGRSLAKPTQLRNAQLRIPATADEVRALQGSAPSQITVQKVSTAALKAKFGQPQKNRKLFGIVGPRIIPRGRVYRGMLNRIDRHQSDIANLKMATDGKSRSKQIQQLDGNLQSLQKLIAKQRAKQPPGSNAKDLKDLTDMILREQQLLAQLDSKSDTPSMTFADALKMKQRGLPPAAVSDLKTFNSSNETSRHQLGHGAVNTVDKVTYAHNPAQPMVFKSAPPTDHQMEAPGCCIGISKDYPNYASRNVATSLVSTALGMDVIPDTKFAKNGDDFGTVMAMVDGKSPLDSVGSQLPSRTQVAGIRDAANDLQLELAVDPGSADTNFFDRLQQKYTIDAATNMFMTDVKLMSQLDTDDSILLNKLNDLLWLDLVTGQSDRHPGNYMIERDRAGQVSGLKGIDNDFCFGKKLTNLTETDRWSTMGATKLPGMPPLIDSNTRDALRTMAATWDQSGGMAEQLGQLLTPEEVSAAKTRLFARSDGAEGFTGLLEHLDQLEASGSVVPVGQWDSGTPGRTRPETRLTT